MEYLLTQLLLQMTSFLNTWERDLQWNKRKTGLMMAFDAFCSFSSMTENNCGKLTDFLPSKNSNITGLRTVFATDVAKNSLTIFLNVYVITLSIFITHSIHATNTTGRWGHMVNDAEEECANCKMKRIGSRLCLFASKNIFPGEEHQYDYGYADNLWWRKKVSYCLFKHYSQWLIINIVKVWMVCTNTCLIKLYIADRGGCIVW